MNTPTTPSVGDMNWQIAVILHQTLMRYFQVRDNSTTRPSPAMPEQFRKPWNELDDEYRNWFAKIVGIAMQSEPPTDLEFFHNCRWELLRKNGWISSGFDVVSQRTTTCMQPMTTVPLVNWTDSIVFAALLDAIRYSYKIPEEPPEVKKMNEDRRLHPPTGVKHNEMIHITGSVHCDSSIIMGDARRSAGLTIEEWNDLPQQVIDGHFERVLTKIREETSSVGLVPPAPADFDKKQE